MKTTKVIIEKVLPDLNSYINAERSNRMAAASIKKNATELCERAFLRQCKKVFTRPVNIIFNWYAPNDKKDRDNIAFAKKFILDGMVKSKVIKDDAWENILNFGDRFAIDCINPRVEVEIIEI